MHLGFYSYVFFPESFLVNELCFMLSKEGHDVSVSTGLPNYATGNFHSGYCFSGPYYESVQGVKILRYPVFPRKKGFLFLTLNYLSNVLFGLLNIFRLRKTDVSLIFGVSPILIAIPAIILKKIYGTPVIIWLQDLWPESFGAVAKVGERNLIYKMVAGIVRWIYANTDVMMIQSQAFRDNLSQMGFKGRIEYIPNWAPQVVASPDLQLEWLPDFPADSFVLTFAGNVGRAQSLDTLLDALKITKNRERLKVLIVGDGSDLARIKERVLNENIKDIYFFGRKPVCDMPALFARSSCLYVSLTCDKLFSSVIPSKIQAYLSSGCPILACIDGEGARIVEEACSGLTCAAENAKQLSQKIEHLLTLSPDELRKMGSCGQQYYRENFQAPDVARKIENILKEAVR